MSSQNGHYDADGSNYETRQGINNSTVIDDTRGSANQDSTSDNIKLSSTSILDLGANKNYKTKTIQDRWETQRALWLDSKNHKNNETGYDPRDGIASEELPMDHKKRSTIEPGLSMRKMVKMTMRSVQSPYEPFEAYYPLDEVIDTYMEIWYQSDSDDSSS